jgi:hypothetical protein
MYDISAMVNDAVTTTRFLHGRSVAEPRRRWTAQEREYLRENANRMPLGQIATEMGRSRQAIKIKVGRYRLGRQVKRDDEISLHDAGELMGKCGKSLCDLHERGVFPARVLPHDGIRALAVSLPRLYRWAVQPQNWVYFDAEGIRDEKLRRLVLLAQSRWPDEWLTTGQVMERVNGRFGHALLHHTDVNRAIVNHGLPAVRWYNWRIKASDMDAFDWAAIKGGAGSATLFPWNSGCDEYVVLASAVGLPRPLISHLCGWTEDPTGKRPGYRVKTLGRNGELPTLAAAVGAETRDGLLFADWRQHTGRFPGMARGVARWWAGRETAVDRMVIVRIASVWAAWYAETAEQARFAQSLKPQSRIGRDALQRHLDTLAGWGLDPLGVEDAA